MKARRLASLVLIAVAVVATACGGNGEEVSGTPPPPIAHTPMPTAPADGGARSLVSLALSRALLGGVGPPVPETSTGGPERRLESVLLREEDLPEGYRRVGETSGTVATPQGSISMAVRSYLRGREGEAPEGVISMAFLLPPQALAQAQGELARGAWKEGVSTLKDVLRSLEIRELDVKGLGEHVLGLRLRWSLQGTSTGQGQPASLVADMVMWLRDERLLVLTAVYPEGATGPDVRTLASAVDRRAQQS